MDSTTLLALLSVVSSFVLVIVTTLYVRESKKIREAQTNPNIGIWIENLGRLNSIYLVIENVGLGPAYNLKFIVDPEFIDQKGIKLSEKGIIKSGIKYFAPNRRIQYYLVDWITPADVVTGDRKIPKQFKIVVNYENAIKKRFEESFLIDFSHLSGLD